TVCTLGEFAMHDESGPSGPSASATSAIFALTTSSTKTASQEPLSQSPLCLSSGPPLSSVLFWSGLELASEGKGTASSS
ncbi:hypothetical protein KI387_014869, partial [Taxus chinensis]